jgi:hypothetical protein
MTKAVAKATMAVTAMVMANIAMPTIATIVEIILQLISNTLAYFTII